LTTIRSAIRTLVGMTKNLKWGRSAGALVGIVSCCSIATRFTSSALPPILLRICRWKGKSK
jgi:hypothetical protein